MKRFAIVVFAVLALGLCCESAQASWGSLGYGGQQPWWNIFAKRNRNLSCEEERLERFWHDYYDALKRYYGALDHIDWVAYYKNHGYQINASCNGGPCGGASRIQFAPVFVSPTMQWAVPNGNLNGPPVGQMGGGYPAAPMGYPAPIGYPAAGGGYPPMMGYQAPPMGGYGYAGGYPPQGGYAPQGGFMPAGY